MGELISDEEFQNKKVDWFVRQWHYGRHSDETFTSNMIHMGFEKSIIEQALNDYYNGEEEDDS